MARVTVDRQALLALALDAATAAGRLLVDERPADLGVAATKSTLYDVVTEMDLRAEKLLVERLLGERPGDAVLGEESGESAGTSGVRWVLDPIDGTVNYLYGLPAWGVSVAAEVAGESVAGVLHVPMMGDTFTAVRGGGAWLGERRLQVNTGVPLDRALVATGFGYDAPARGRQGEVVQRLVSQVRDIRRYGSAAVDLCNVAAGRVDAYFERFTNRWDVAAAGLVAEEAGALVTDLRGGPPSGGMVLAAAPDLHAPLAVFLRELRADEDWSP
jgi:myo-inositol-1(or 4)-monophosphatase